jgi:biofilm PGA synthesis protein PgaA
LVFCRHEIHSKGRLPLETHRALRFLALLILLAATILRPGEAESETTAVSALAAAHDHAAQGDYFAVLAICDRILQDNPTHREAQRQRILALNALGAPFLAADLAAAEPDLLTAEEWFRLRGHQGALAVRWGRLPTASDQDRFAATDRALALLEENQQRLDGSHPAADAFRHQARFDRMAALRDRSRMAEVVDEFESLQQEGVSLPYYALAAAGDAFLYLRRPEEARDLYLQALETDPEPFATQLSLFYAYVALDDFSHALALVDTLSAGLPPWQPGYGAEPVAVPEKLAADVAAALGILFGGKPAVAQDRLEGMLVRAPYNRDLYREVGNVHAMRGWSRRAGATYRLGLALEPRHRGLQIGRAAALLDLKEFQVAGPLVGELSERYPENLEVRRLQRWWDTSQLRELHVSAAGGRSTGTQLGSRDMSLGATLFSAPFRHHYRAFISSSVARARFPEGTETWQRYGVGLDCRRADWDAAAEITYNAYSGDDVGGRLSGTWRRDDHWSFPASVERFSAHTPLRALKHGIHADAAELAILYRHSESRRLDIRGQVMDFTDGNFRRSLAAHLVQRLVSRPRCRLDLALDLYGSANSRTGTPYFNPEGDFAAELTLDGTWQLYRRYERAFSHRLALSAGEYRQKGFGGEPVGSVLYEHIWAAGDRLDIVYGVSRSRRVYDGASEYQNRLHSSLVWRF